MNVATTMKNFTLIRLPDSAIPGFRALDFTLPPELEASEPPEARGLARDEVRLMVSYCADDRVVHGHFRALPDFLAPGDLLVINTSGTLNAALAATRADGTPLELHLSTRLPAGMWLVEVRRPDGDASAPFPHASAGETLGLPGGAHVTLHAPYQAGEVPAPPSVGIPPAGPVRLCIAGLNLSERLERYLERYGFPIRYSYVRQRWPASYY